MEENRDFTAKRITRRQLLSGMTAASAAVAATACVGSTPPAPPAAPTPAPPAPTQVPAAPATVTAPTQVPAAVAQQSAPGASSQRKVDIFCHVLPPKYKDAIFQIMRPGMFFYDVIASMPQFWDMQARFKLTDPIEGYVQLISLMQPPIESIVDANKSPELARLANDGMAEMVQQYPTKFVGAVGSVPLNNIAAALEETDRCITKLGFKGIQIFTPANGKPLDSAEFLPLYERMVKHNLPIWLHPQRDEDVPYYAGEPYARYRENVSFGWPFETTLGMNRIVFSGLMERFPTLKFVVHHAGAMVPFFQSRIPAAQDRPGGQPPYGALKKPAVEYFKAFYPDVASMAPGPLALASQFFGPDHMVFGSDFPFGNLPTLVSTVEKSGLAPADLAKIWEGNYKKLLGLS